jgi:hypothetical protein
MVVPVMTFFFFFFDVSTWVNVVVWHPDLDKAL